MEQIKALVEKMNAEWVVFKAENDRAEKERAEKGGKADPLTEAKIARHSEEIGKLQAQLDDFAMKANRPGVGEAPDAKKAAHRKAFAAFMRKGNDTGLAELQAVAGVSVGTDTEGGYLVPETIDAEIERFERDNTPMRQACRVIKVSNENYSKLVNQGGATSGWVGEKEARPETAAPTWAELVPYFGEIYANPGATQKALDDVGMNLEAWLGEEVGLEFAEQENDAYTAGTGVKKPNGILSYTLSTNVDGTRTFGEIQKVASGSSGAFVIEKLIDLVHALKAPYRIGAAMMLNTLSLAAIRKLKSGDTYVFQPSLLAGQPSTLLGYPIIENDDMPVPAADAKALIFGNFQRGYTIVDVQGTRVLRDPYTNKPKVHFYTTKRTGGHVVNDRALKVMVLT